MSDLIDRQAAIDVIHKAIFDFFDICDDDVESPMTYKDEVLLELNKALSTQIKYLPSAQPEMDEWCDDCKEYDTDKHCCPRWNRVIREAVKQTERQWIPCSERLPEPGRYLVTYNLINGMPYVNICEYGVTLFSEDKERVFYYTNADCIDCEREDVLAWMPLPEPARLESGQWEK